MTRRHPSGWPALALACLLLAGASGVRAEDFSVVVMRGSTIVQVHGSGDGRIREEVLREDPLPDPPAPADAGAPPGARSGPTLRILLQEDEEEEAVPVFWPIRGFPPGFFLHGRHPVPHPPSRRPARPGRLRSASALR